MCRLEVRKCDAPVLAHAHKSDGYVLRRLLRGAHNRSVLRTMRDQQSAVSRASCGGGRTGVGSCGSPTMAAMAAMAAMARFVSVAWVFREWQHSSPREPSCALSAASVGGSKHLYRNFLSAGACCRPY